MSKIEKFTITMLLLACIFGGYHLLTNPTSSLAKIGYTCLCTGTILYFIGSKMKD